MRVFLIAVAALCAALLPPSTPALALEGSCALKTSSLQSMGSDERSFFGERIAEEAYQKGAVEYQKWYLSTQGRTSDEESLEVARRVLESALKNSTWATLLTKQECREIASAWAKIALEEADKKFPWLLLVKTSRKHWLP